MSLSISGLNANVSGGEIFIKVPNNNYYVLLANHLNFNELYEILEPELKKTKNGAFQKGRKLTVRIHIGILILQCLTKLTDRQISDNLSLNAAFQIFCGLQNVDKWHVPHYSKIEEFRNRFSPSTHHKISQFILKTVRKLGYTNGETTDSDSTIMEANMAYPSDAQLLVKLTNYAAKSCLVLKRFKHNLIIKPKEIKAKSKEYFFLAKKTAKNIKKIVFKELHKLVMEQVLPVIDFVTEVTSNKMNVFTNRNKVLFEKLLKGMKYLQDVAKFIRTQKIEKSKILSFNLNQVACISKGKLGKNLEFGRVFQLSRLDGNYMMILKANDVLQSDKSAIPKVIYAHRNIYGAGILKNISADKGYHSDKNRTALKRAGIEDGIQRPSNSKILGLLSKERKEELYNRRAGIEPLIGHVKNFGLRRSKMKSDTTIEASAYRSVIGFNLNQLIREFEITGENKYTQKILLA